MTASCPSARPLIVLDGAMGTELTRRGADTTLPLWSARALIESPAQVTAIHRDYIAAGAQVITADTFRTNTRTLARAGLGDHVRDLNLRAVELAQQARGDARVRVAGSIAPVEDCYSPWLAPGDGALASEHSELARYLADAGCDLIIVETMNSIREAIAAARAAAATDLPLWVSFTLNERNELLTGEPLADAVRQVLPFRPEAVLVNCIPVAQIASALDVLARAAGGTPFGAYGNVGHVDDVVGWTLTDAVSPQAYARAAMTWRDTGASIIGGCCGTTPEHIAAITATFAAEAAGQSPPQRTAKET